jgi:predicted Zn-dependent protease
MSEERIAQLKEILSQEPHNHIARYALGLEFSNAGQFDAAIAEFRALLIDHPTYVPAYQMMAQTMMRAGQNAGAREALNKGIEAASAIGNAHAQSEMQAMLDELG